MGSFWHSVLLLSITVGTAYGQLTALSTSTCGSATIGVVEQPFVAATTAYSVTVPHECTLHDPSAQSFPVISLSVRATVSGGLGLSLTYQDPIDILNATTKTGTFSVTSGVGTATVPIRYLNPQYPTSIVSITAGTVVYTITVRRLDRSPDSTLLSLGLFDGLDSTYNTSGKLFYNFGHSEGYTASVSSYAAEFEPGITAVRLRATMRNGFQRLRVIQEGATVLATANATDVSITLVSGANVTVTIEVLSQAYQPVTGLPGYNVQPGTFNNITVGLFKRTPSTLAQLANIILNDKFNASQVYPLNRNVVPQIRDYLTLSPVYYNTSVLRLIIKAPDTTAPVSSIFNTNRGGLTYAKLNDTLNGPVSQVSVLTAVTGSLTEGIDLAPNATTCIQINVTSEACCNQTTYHLYVARRAPSQDPGLADMTFVFDYVNNTGGLPSAWVIPADSNPAQLRQNFSTAVTTYSVRGYHGYYYQGAVLPPNTTLVSLRPKVVTGAIVNGRAVSRIFVNQTTEVFDMVFSPNFTVSNPGSIGWPRSAVTTLAVLVVAEDGLTNRTYTFRVAVAAEEPQNQTFWSPFFNVNVTNTSHPWYPEYNRPQVLYQGDLRASIMLLANTTMGVVLGVNDTKWATDVVSVIPALSGDYSPIRDMDFFPATSINGTSYTFIGQSVPSSSSLFRTLSLPASGFCPRNTFCKFGRCVPLTWTANPDPRIHKFCNKTLTAYLRPVTVGNTSLGMLVSSTTGYPIGGPFTYVQEYINVTLANSTIVIDPASVNGDGTVTAQWSVNATLFGRDYFGNLAVNDNRAPNGTDLKVMVCPNMTVAGQQAFPREAGATNANCLCGAALGCVKPLFGNVTSLRNGLYALEMPLLRAGLNYYSVILPRQRGLGGVRPLLDNLIFNTSRLLGVVASTPLLPVTVVPNAVGLGSRLEFTGVNYTIVDSSPPYYFIRARDEFGNNVLQTGLEANYRISTTPLTRTVGGAEPGSIAIAADATTAGLYKVQMPTTRSGFYNLTLTFRKTVSDPFVACTGDTVFSPTANGVNYTYGSFSLAPKATFWPFFLRAGPLDISLTTVSYVWYVVARTYVRVRVDARDSFGNQIIFPADDVSSRLRMNLSFINGTAFVDRDIKARPNTTFGPVPLVNGGPEPYHAINFIAPEKTNDTYFMSVYGYDLVTNDWIPVHGGADTVSDRTFVVHPDIPVIANTTLYWQPTQRAGQVILGIRPIDKTGNPSYKGNFTVKVTPLSYTPFAYPARSGVDYFAPFYVPVTNDTFQGLPETQLVPLGTNSGVRDPNARRVDRIGTYLLELQYLSGVPVSYPDVSPSTLTVLTSPPSIVSKVSALPRSVGLGQKLTAFIQAYDAYGNQVTTGGESSSIQVIISNKNDPNDFIPAGVTDNGDGNYAVTWIMTKPGFYRAIFRFSGVPREPIAEIEVTQSLVVGNLLTQFSQPFITEAGVAGSFLRVTAGDEMSVTVLVPPAADLSTFPESQVNATLTYLLGDKTIVDKITFPKRSTDGRQTLSLRLTLATTYVLDLLSDGISLPGGPYNLEVVPLPASFAAIVPINNTVHNVTSNSSAYNMTAGSSVEMYLMLRDRYSNLAKPNFLSDIMIRFDPVGDGVPVFAKLQYPPTASGFIAQNNSAVVASAVLTRTGTYTVSAYLGNRSICQFPRRFSNVCLPSIVVFPGTVNSSTSLLVGSSTCGVSIAGSSLNARVLLHDTYGNPLFRTAPANRWLSNLATDVGDAGAPYSRFFPVVNVSLLVFGPLADDGTGPALINGLMAVGSDGILARDYTLVHPGQYLVEANLQVGNISVPIGSTGPLTVGVLHAPPSAPDSSFYFDFADGPAHCTVGKDCRVRMFLYDVYGSNIADLPDSDVRIMCSVNTTGPTFYRVYSEQGQIRLFHATDSDGSQGLEGSFTVPKTGSLTCSVWLVDQLFRSATTVVVPGPVAVDETTAYGEGLAYARPGQTMTFYVEPKDAYGNLVLLQAGADLEASYGVSVGITLRPLYKYGGQRSSVMTIAPTIVVDQRRATVTYTVTDAGELTICLTVGGQCSTATAAHLGVSPRVLSVVAADASAASATVYGPGLSCAVSGQAGWFHLFARDMYGNVVRSYSAGYLISLELLMASTTTLGGRTFLQAVHDPVTGRHSIPFTAPSVGAYKLVLKDKGTTATAPIPYYNLTVVADPGTTLSVARTYADGPGLEYAVAGSLAEFSIVAVDNKGCARTTGTDTFAVDIVPTAGATVQIGMGRSNDGTGITYESNGIYRAVFNLTVSGTYQLTVSVVSGATKTALGGGAVITADSAQAQAFPVPIRVVANSLSLAQASLAVPAGDINVTAGQAFFTEVRARDAFGNLLDEPLRQLLAGEVFQVLAVDSEDQEFQFAWELPYNATSRTFNAPLTLTRSGTYTLDAVLKGRPSPLLSMPVGSGGNKTLRVLPAGVDVSRSTFSGAALRSITAGEASNFTISLVDNYSKAAPVSADDVAVKCRVALVPGLDNTCATKSLQCSLKADESGSALVGSELIVLLNHTCAGTYALSVKYGTDNLLGSPFSPMVIRPAPISGPNSTISSSAAIATVRQATTFIVQPRDVFGNSVKVPGLALSGALNTNVTGVTVASAAFTYLANGSYLATYTPPGVGAFKLSVSLNNQLVARSPYTFNVSAAQTSAALSYASGDGASFAIAGAATTFDVVSIDVTGSRQDASVSDQYLVRITHPNITSLLLTPVAAAGSSPASYRVVYTLQQAVLRDDGVQIPYVMSVTLGGRAIKGSPFSLTIKPSTAVATRTVLQTSGSVLIASGDNIVGQAGVPLFMIVQTRDAFGNNGNFDQFSTATVNITATVAYNDSAPAPVPLVAPYADSVNLRDGRFQLNVYMFHVGIYRLNVFLGGSAVSNGASVRLNCTSGGISYLNYTVEGRGVTDGLPATSGAVSKLVVRPRDFYGNDVVGGTDALPLTARAIYTASGDIRSGVERFDATVLSQLIATPGSADDAGVPYTVGSTIITYIPHGTGRLVVNMSVGEQLIGGKVHSSGLVVSGSVLANRSTIFGLGLDGVLYNTTAGLTKPIIIVIEPRDEFDNLVLDRNLVAAGGGFSVVATQGDPRARITGAGAASRRSDGRYEVRLTTNSTVGPLSVRVTYGGQTVVDGQFDVSIYTSLPDPSPELAVVDGTGASWGVVGSTSTFTVTLTSYPCDGCSPVYFPSSMGSSYVDVLFNGTSGLAYSGIAGFQVLDYANGTYGVSFSPRISGSISLAVRLGGAVNADSGAFYSYEGELLVYSGAPARLATRFYALDGTIYPPNVIAVQGYGGLPLRLTVSPFDAEGNPTDFVSVVDPALDDKVPPMSSVALVRIVGPGTIIAYSSATPYIASEVPTIQHGALQRWAYDVSLLPQVAGAYTIEVYRAGVAAPVYTCGLQVIPGLPNPRSSYVIGLGASRTIAGASATFSLALADAPGNQLGNGVDQVSLFVTVNGGRPYYGPIVNGSLVGTDNRTCPISFVYDATSQTYVASYQCSVAGTYNLMIAVIGVPFLPNKASGQVIIDPGSLSVLTSTVAGPAAGVYGTLVAGVPSSLILTTRDALGNRVLTSGASFGVTVGNTSVVAEPPTVLDLLNGTYIITYRAILAGRYPLIIKRNGQVIRSANVTVTVVPAETASVQKLRSGLILPRTSVAYNDGLLASFVAGSRVSFALTPVDLYGNPISLARDLYLYEVCSPRNVDYFGTLIYNSTIPYLNNSESFTVSEPLGIRVYSRGSVVTDGEAFVLPGRESEANSSVVLTAAPVTSAYSTGYFPEQAFLVLRDQYGNLLRQDASATSVSLILIKSDLTERILAAKSNGDGTYTSTYMVIEADSYNVTAQFIYPSTQGQGLQVRRTPSSPLTITAGPLNLTNTVITDSTGTVGTLGSAAYAGIPTYFTIRFFDENLNPRNHPVDPIDLEGLDLRLTITSPLDSVERTLVLGQDYNRTYNSPAPAAFNSCLITNGRLPYLGALRLCKSLTGLHNFTFYTTLAGNMRLYVSAGVSQLLTRSKPYGCHVKPSETVDGTRSLVYGPGLEGVVAGTPSLVYVQGKDKYGNLLEDPLVQGFSWRVRFNLSSELGPSASVIDNMIFTSDYLSGGKYLIIYSAPTSGIQNVDYILTVTVFLARSTDNAGTALVRTVPVQASIDLTNSNVASRPPDATTSVVLHTNQSSLISGGVATGMGAVRTQQTFTVIVRDQSYVPLSKPITSDWLSVIVSPAPANVTVTQYNLGNFRVAVTMAYPGAFSIVFLGNGSQLGSKTLLDKSVAGTFEVIVPPGGVEERKQSRMLAPTQATRRIRLSETLGVASSAGDAVLGRLVPAGTSFSSYSTRAGSFFVSEVIERDTYGNRVWGDIYTGYDIFDFHLRLPDASRRRALQESSIQAPAWTAPLVRLVDPCSVTGTPDSKSAAICPVYGAGNYILGADLLIVSGDGIPLASSVNGSGVPVSVVHSGINPVYSFVYIQPSYLTDGVTTGMQVSLPIVARDRYGNLHTSGGLLFSVTILNAATGNPDDGLLDVTSISKPSISLLSTGMYMVTFTPVLGGLHQVLVYDIISQAALGFTTLATQLDSGAVPFSLPIQRELYVLVKPNLVDPLYTEVGGPGLMGAVASEPVVLNVVPYDSSRSPTEANITLRLEDGTTGMTIGVPFFVTQTVGVESGNGIPKLIYAVTFTIDAVVSVKAYVYLNGALWPQSPLTIQISPRPAPVPTSAVFSTDLTSLSITFSLPTNLAGTNLEASAPEDRCSIILAPETMAKLGTTPLCSWTTASVLRVLLGNNPTITPTSMSADNLVFVPGVILNAASNSLSVAGAVSIVLPSDGGSLAPAAILSAPAQISRCDVLVLDASASQGGGGRTLNFSWSVQLTVSGIGSSGLALDPDTQRAVVRILGNAVAEAEVPSYIRIDTSLLPNGFTLEFTVRVTNFLGLTGTSFTQVSITDLPVPTMALSVASPVTVIRSALTTVEVVATAPRCDARSSSSLLYSWQQKDGPDIRATSSAALYSAFAASLNSRTLILPSNMLLAASQYSFQATVTLAPNTSLTVTKDLQVVVDPSPLMARVIGGNTSTPLGVGAVLRAVPYDPDAPATGPEAFIYTWACTFQPPTLPNGAVQASRDCYPANTDGHDILESAADVVALSSSMLNQTGTYFFSALIQREPVVEGRGIVVYSFLETVDMPVTSNTTYAVTVSGPSARRVDPSRRITLQGLILASDGSPAPGYNWTLVSPVTLASKLSLVTEGGLSSPQLNIKADALAGGQSYVFRLYGTGGASAYYSQLELQTDEKPWGGSLQITPSSGIEITTRFTLLAPSWVDRAEDFPLTYQFFYVPNTAPSNASTAAAAAAEVPLGAPQQGNSLTVILAEGSHSVGVYVMDGLGMATRLVRDTAVTVASRNNAGRRLMAQTQPRSTNNSLPVDYSQATLEANAQTDITSAFDVFLAGSDYNSAFMFANIFGLKYGSATGEGTATNCSSVYSTFGVFEDFITGLETVILSYTAISSTIVTQGLCPLSLVTNDPKRLTVSAVAAASASASFLVQSAYVTPSVSLSLAAETCAIRLLGNLMAAAESDCFTLNGTRQEDSLPSIQSFASYLTAVLGRDLRPGTPDITLAYQGLVELTVGRTAVAPGNQYTLDATGPSAGPGVTLGGTLALGGAIPAPSMSLSYELVTGVLHTSTVSMLPLEAVTALPARVSRRFAGVYGQLYTVQIPSGSLGAASLSSSGAVLLAQPNADIGLSGAVVQLTYGGGLVSTAIPLGSQPRIASYLPSNVSAGWTRDTISTTGFTADSVTANASVLTLGGDGSGLKWVGLSIVSTVPVSPPPPPQPPSPPNPPTPQAPPPPPAQRKKKDDRVLKIAIGVGVGGGGLVLILIILIIVLLILVKRRGQKVAPDNDKIMAYQYDGENGTGGPKQPKQPIFSFLPLQHKKDAHIGEDSGTDVDEEEDPDHAEAIKKAARKRLNIAGPAKGNGAHADAYKDPSLGIVVNDQVVPPQARNADVMKNLGFLKAKNLQ